jgi:hypothetical protein
MDAKPSVTSAVFLDGTGRGGSGGAGCTREGTGRRWLGSMMRFERNLQGGCPQAIFLSSFDETHSASPSPVPPPSLGQPDASKDVASPRMVLPGREGEKAEIRGGRWETLKKKKSGEACVPVQRGSLAWTVVFLRHS